MAMERESVSKMTVSSMARFVLLTAGGKPTQTKVSDPVLQRYKSAAGTTYIHR